MDNQQYNQHTTSNGYNNTLFIREASAEGKSWTTIEYNLGVQCDPLIQTPYNVNYMLYFRSLLS